MDKDLLIAGIGGGGCNSVDRFGQSHDFEGVSLLLIGTDEKALEAYKTERKLLIGKALTSGYGSGGIPEVGTRCALEDIESIKEIGAAKRIVLVAGLGGGTGSGVLPVIAELAKRRCDGVYAAVTTPFRFEGEKRYNIAMEYLRKTLDLGVRTEVVGNDQIFDRIDKDTSFTDAFRVVDGLIRDSILEMLGPESAS